MRYHSKRDMVLAFIKNDLLNTVAKSKQAVSFDKTVSYICMEKAAPRHTVEECLKDCIELGYFTLDKVNDVKILEIGREGLRECLTHINQRRQEVDSVLEVSK